MAGFKRYISSLPRSPLVEAASRLYESLTEPTMWLRSAYRKNGERQPNPETPKFNEVWKNKHPYESAGNAFDYLRENPRLACEIVSEILPQDPDGLAFDYKDRQGYDFDEPDFIALVEQYPHTACRVIYNDDGYMQSDAQTLDFNHTVVNGWLVHNTDAAWDIWKEGFQYGDDMGSLAYSNAGSIAGKEYGDYLFAFPIDDAPSPSYRFHKLRYGDSSVVFIGTGNEFYHSGDEEDQVIFDRRQPTGCFVVDESDGYWCVYGKSDRPLVRFEEYSDCLKWIKKNGYDYRNQMRMWNKATPGRQVASEKRWK